MDSGPLTALAIAMRWVHIVSIATILGGFVFARFAFYPALSQLPESVRGQVGPAVAARFRALLYTVAAAALVSGVYNYLTKPSYPRGYHMWIGIKILFVLHALAAAILYGVPGADDRKRPRWAAGIVASALVIVLISGWLRWLTLHPPAAL